MEKVSDKQLNSKVFFTQRYLDPAKRLVSQVLDGKKADEALVCQIAGITPEKLKEAHTILTPPKRGMMGKGKAKPVVQYTNEQKAEARAITEVERTITNIVNYKLALENSPEQEMQSVLNALSGGYIAPTSGGDAVATCRQYLPVVIYMLSMPRPLHRNRLGRKEKNWSKIRLLNTGRLTVIILVK